MPIKRTYAELGDACRAAGALDLVGDRWTLVIVRELVFEARRFADLIADVRGITPAVLTARLRALQDAGIVWRSDHAGDGEPVAYALTDWGRGLEVILQELGRWELAGPTRPHSGGMTPNAVMLAMRTMAPSEAAGGRPINFRLRDDRRRNPPVHEYAAEATEAGLQISLGLNPSAVAMISADSTTWAHVVFQGATLIGTETADNISIDGDRTEVERLIALFTRASADAVEAEGPGPGESDRGYNTP